MSPTDCLIVANVFLAACFASERVGCQMFCLVMAGLWCASSLLKGLVL